MVKELFNDNWIYYRDGEENNKTQITLPHDAMIYENRTMNAKGAHNISYFEGYKYFYEKEFVLNEEDNNKDIFLEFEGVYHNAEVYINGKLVAKRPYGYTDFFVEITQFVEFNKKNKIVVIADNSDQPNSRWYSGSGIYRDVYLYKLDKKHINLNGVKIKTLDYKKKLINVNVKTNCEGNLKISILDGDKIVAIKEVETNGNADVLFEEEQLSLWSPKTPNLYHCKVEFYDDEVIERFGVRQVELDLNNGLTINGNREIIYGACIHHDNGLLGAAAYKFAEYRKVRLLKENGYNAIRSAHNPCSKYLLDACDEMGILMMDEYVDCWYIHKTEYDYVNQLMDNWQQDLKEMVDKDFNHPCVILYSSGNEVSETSQKRGIKLTKEFTDYFHSLDDTRPVTCGVNIFFNFLSSVGFGVYSDKKAKKSAEEAGKKKKKAVGSEFFNNLASMMGAGFMKRGAALHGSDVKTRDAFANMDVAGYNYGILRYKHDLKKYPNRYILGSETFCADAYVFKMLAEENPRVIGDFVWAGIDYIGEVGIGSWTVEEYTKDFDHQVGWLTAGSGRIDITGKPTSESDFTKVVFGYEKINMGVIPVPHYKMKHSPSSWKLSRAEASWNYPGCEGMQTKVEVYAVCDYVKLYLNDKCLGKKKFNKSAIMEFKVKYVPGVLKAISYDKDNKVIGEVTLSSGSDKVMLNAYPELNVIGDNDLAYIRFKYTDENGVLNTLARGDIKIDKIENGKLLGFGHACSYNDRGYITDISDTFYGEALAIVKPLKKNSPIKLQASSKYGDVEVNVDVK